MPRKRKIPIIFLLISILLPFLEISPDFFVIISNSVIEIKKRPQGINTIVFHHGK